MAFTTEAELRAYILSTFTANGVRDITGPEAQEAFIGILDLMSSKLQADLGVSVEAGKVGGAKNGATLLAGTTVESVLRTILREAVPPTYSAPTLTLNTSLTDLNREIGSIISPTFTKSFIQNDGGVEVTRYLTKNGSQIATSIPYTDLNYQLTGSVAYQLFATYAQGNCKNNSLGTQDCTGRIQPGTASSNVITYNAWRRLFYGTPVSSISTSAGVRSLANSSLNPLVGTSFVINIPGGSQRVVFAYPAVLQDPSSIKYREFGGCEVKAIFTKTIVSVEGANGYTSIDYKVFTYQPIEAFQVAANYEVTI